ncbi:MAG: helix-turn-helix transcriptional regulator [Solobacterium sp.]|nr:helix-turn-helix transcriptional regulator [Solobacterium sp.]
MTEFSDILKKYLSEKNKSVISMAANCNTNKSTMYKILKGARNPASLDLVRRMASYLQLTPSEEEKFIEAYRITREGKIVYFRRKEVEKLLRTPFIDTVISDNYLKTAAGDTDPSSIRMFDNVNDVNRNLIRVLLKEAEKKQGKISVYATCADEPFSVFLGSLLQEHPGLSMEYIITINDDSFEYTSDNSGFLNLVKLKCILQMASRGNNSRFYYQYSTFSGSSDHQPYFTNVILTTDAVVLMSAQKDHSLCIRDTQICLKYRDLFAGALSVSRPLVTFANAVEQMFFYLAELSFSNVGPKMIFEMAPCFFGNVTEQLLRDKIRPDVPDRDLLIQKVLDYTRFNSSVIRSGKVQMIHAFDGYRDFMEHGILRDIPTSMYIPLNMEERISMLDRYIRTIDNSSLCVLKEPIGPVKNSLYVFLYDSSLMFQFVNNEGNLILMQLDRFTYYEAFEDYLKALLSKTELFYTKEELTEKLKELLAEYRARCEQQDTAQATE